jgi:hypothetical protein
MRKISPSPGFDPRTVQPVAQSLYRLRYPGPRFGEVESINFQYKRTHITSIFRVEKSGPIWHGISWTFSFPECVSSTLWCSCTSSCTTRHQNVSLSIFMHHLQSSFRKMHNENTVPIRNVVVSLEVIVMPPFHTWQQFTNTGILEGFQ